jgi:hypothetical protein
MFEKEAEEIAKEIDIHHFDDDVNYPCVLQAITIGVQKGAGFGYNKANEWHYVKDGISPTHSYRVLVFTDEGVGFGIYGLDDKKWHTYDTGFEVIAWKEIVLPKESE